MGLAGVPSVLSLKGSMLWAIVNLLMMLSLACLSAAAVHALTHLLVRRRSRS